MCDVVEVEMDFKSVGLDVNTVTSMTGVLDISDGRTVDDAR